MGAMSPAEVPSDPMEPVEPRWFAGHLARWVAESGPEADVAVSSRVRLARNLEGVRFRTRYGPEEALGVASRARAALADVLPRARWIPVDSAGPLVRLLLRERYLCSRDLAPVDERDDGLPGRAVAFGVDEDLSVMVNEEDHLRMQAIVPGFALEEAYGRALALDRGLEERLDYAWSEPLGYLTSCPTNVGTGLRASVMLHLPALGMVPSELEKVIRAAQRTGLAVRGIYGEGSRAVGDLYQISNQVTLGRSEEQLLGDLGALVPGILDFERRIRETLAKEHREALRGRVAEARLALSTARSLDSEAALTSLSVLRLGALLGLDEGVGRSDFGRLVIQVQRAHVQSLGPEEPGTELVAPSRRDAWRAAYLRLRFGSPSA